VIGIGTIIWFFTQAPWLQVKHIQIEGQATEETNQVIEQLRRKNILWLSVTHPEEMIIQQQPAIKEIQILRGIPDTLRVKLIEREPAVIWQVDDHWYTLDPTGFVFREQQVGRKEDGSLDLPGTDLPVVVDTKKIPIALSQTIVRPQFITFIRSVMEQLPERAGVQFVRAEVDETTFVVTVVTDASWKILFDTTRTLESQLKTVAKVLELKRSEIHEYIDVRVRGWVYYK
jgi:hypothetical protein